MSGITTRIIGKDGNTFTAILHDGGAGTQIGILYLGKMGISVVVSAQNSGYDVFWGFCGSQRKDARASETGKTCALKTCYAFNEHDSRFSKA